MSFNIEFKHQAASALFAAIGYIALLDSNGNVLSKLKPRWACNYNSLFTIDDTEFDLPLGTTATAVGYYGNDGETLLGTKTLTPSVVSTYPAKVLVDSAATKLDFDVDQYDFGEYEPSDANSGSSSGTTDPATIAMLDGLTKTVYVNALSPTTATIFDVENPPLNNDDTLKNEVTNMYVGTDGSIWTTDGTTYKTYTAPSKTAWFINGTAIDNGSDKTGDIKHTGDLFIGLDGLVRVGHGKSNIPSNTAVGGNALSAVTTGTGNIGIGTGALKAVTSGSSNVGIGWDASPDVTTGTGNISIGTNASLVNATGSYNIAVGLDSLKANKANYNIGIGYLALGTNSTGSYNVGLGHLALRYTTASNNIGVGY